MSHDTAERALLGLKLGDVVLSRRDVLYPSLGSRIPSGDEWPLIVLTPPHDTLGGGYVDLRVAPVSLDAGMAGPEDVLCAAGDGPLGAPFVIELWNQRPGLVANLDRKIGRLTDAAIDRVIAVHNLMIGAAESSIAPDWHGSEIDSDDDPRLVHQGSRAAAASFLSSPVDDLLHLPRSIDKQHIADALTSFEYEPCAVAHRRNMWLEATAHEAFGAKGRSYLLRRMYAALVGRLRHTRPVSMPQTDPTIFISGEHSLVAMWAPVVAAMRDATQARPYFAVHEPRHKYDAVDDEFASEFFCVNVRSTAVSYRIHRIHQTAIGFDVVGSIDVSAPTGSRLNWSDEHVSDCPRRIAISHLDTLAGT